MNYLRLKNVYWFPDTEHRALHCVPATWHRNRQIFPAARAANTFRGLHSNRLLESGNHPESGIFTSGSGLMFLT